MTRDDTLKVPSVNSFGILGHSTGEARIGGRTGGSVKIYTRLILALLPEELLVEVRVGVELLGEKTGLALPGHGILFGGGQVENQVCDYEGL